MTLYIDVYPGGHNFPPENISPHVSGNNPGGPGDNNNNSTASSSSGLSSQANQLISRANSGNLTSNFLSSNDFQRLPDGEKNAVRLAILQAEGAKQLDHGTVVDVQRVTNSLIGGGTIRARDWNRIRAGQKKDILRGLKRRGVSLDKNFGRKTGGLRVRGSDRFKSGNEPNMLGANKRGAGKPFEVPFHRLTRREQAHFRSQAASRFSTIASKVFDVDKRLVNRALKQLSTAQMNQLATGLHRFQSGGAFAFVRKFGSIALGLPGPTGAVNRNANRVLGTKGTDRVNKAVASRDIQRAIDSQSAKKRGKKAQKGDRAKPVSTTMRERRRSQKKERNRSRERDRNRKQNRRNKRNRSRRRRRR